MKFLWPATYAYEATSIFYAHTYGSKNLWFECDFTYVLMGPLVSHFSCYMEM